MLRIHPGDRWSSFQRDYTKLAKVGHLRETLTEFGLTEEDILVSLDQVIS